MKYNALIPELMVSNIKRSISFYKKLGFKEEYKRTNFSFLSLQHNQIMLQQKNSTWLVGKLQKPFGRGINLQMQVTNIRQILHRTATHNITLFEEPTTNWYQVGTKKLGNNEFLVQDPDGYLLRIFNEVPSKK